MRKIFGIISEGICNFGDPDISGNVRLNVIDDIQIDLLAICRILPGGAAQKQFSEQQVEAIIAALQKQGVVTINGTKVSYSLPE